MNSKATMTPDELAAWRESQIAALMERVKRVEDALYRLYHAHVCDIDAQCLSCIWAEVVLDEVKS